VPDLRSHGFHASIFSGALFAKTTTIPSAVADL
jgi:hypothetical protein